MKVKLKDITSLITKGTTPTTLGFCFQSQGIKFVKVESFEADGTFIPSKTSYISEECNEALKRSQLKENDILFSIAGAIGRVAVVTKGMLPCNTNQALAIIRIRDNRVYLPYIKLVLSSSYVSKQFNKLKQGVAQLNLSLTDVGNLEIPLPEYAEQESVSRNLEKLQTCISARRAQLAKLDELVKCRFVELFGDPVVNDKGWPIVRLDAIADIRIGPFGSLLHKEDYQSGNHALVNPSHIAEGKIKVDSTLSVSNDKYNELSAYWLNPGDIVMGRRGEMGRCAVVEHSGLICGTGSLIIRPHGQMKPYFLQNILSRPEYKKIIEDKAVGVTMMNLNVPIVSSLEVPLLPHEQQIEFLGFTHRIDKLRFVIQQSLDETQKLFDSLMQEYFD